MTLQTVENISDSGTAPDVTVVIVSYNTAHLLDRLFSTINAGRGTLRLQTIVIDNASTDNSQSILVQYREVAEIIVNKENLGFGRANNQSIAHIRGRFVLLLNTDAFISDDTLETTIDYMNAHPRCGVLGVMLTGENGELQPSCRLFPTPWNVFLNRTGLSRFFPIIPPVDNPSWDPALEQECDWVPGCYYLIRREVIERVGLFDPRFFLYYEEVDHCRRVKAAGWTVDYCPHTKVVHIGGESAESLGQLQKSSRQLSALQIESEILYFRKHHGRAGLALSVILAMLEAGIETFKGIAKGHSMQRGANALLHLRKLFLLLVKTRFGSRPTR